MRTFICDAILFDLDGVLVDSSRVIRRHWEAWAARHDFDLEEVLRLAHGQRTVETIRMTAPHLNAEEEEAAFTAGEMVDTDGVVAIEGALALLTSIPAGRWTVVTSGSRELATVRLQAAGLPIPGHLVGGDEVQQGKPSPEPYLLGASRLGVLPEACLVVEDAPAGIRSAIAAGMMVIGVATTHVPEALTGAHVVDRLAHIHARLDPETNRRLKIHLDGDEQTH